MHALAGQELRERNWNMRGSNFDSRKGHWNSGTGCPEELCILSISGDFSRSNLFKSGATVSNPVADPAPAEGWITWTADIPSEQGDSMSSRSRVQAVWTSTVLLRVFFPSQIIKNHTTYVCMHRNWELDGNYCYLRKQDFYLDLRTQVAVCFSNKLNTWTYVLGAWWSVSMVLLPLTCILQVQ